MAEREGWTIQRLLPPTAASAIRVALIAVLLITLVVVAGALGGLAFLLLGGPAVVLYLFGLRSVTASVLCGVALIVLALWTADAYDDALRSGSSTAGLAWFFLPVYGVPLVGAVIAVGDAPPVRSVRPQ